MKNNFGDIKYNGFHQSGDGPIPFGDMPFDELPAGLAMAFAQDTDALTRFTNLPTDTQDDIIRRARSVKTRNEMRSLVNSISGDTTPTM